MSQWGVGKTRPSTYAAQNFDPAFQSAPTVTGSIEGGKQGLNDSSCNIGGVNATEFTFIGVKGAGKYVDEVTPFHWIAIGQRKK